MGRTWEPLLAPKWVSERILMGKPVWDRPSQKAVEPGACVEGKERRRRRVGAEAERPVGWSEPRHSQGISAQRRGTRGGAPLPVLGRLFWDSRLGSLGVPWVKQPPWGEKRQLGFWRVKVDKGLLADRAVSEVELRRHRPLPAASPASEAGARLASHLLRIAAAASSRASPAPGMQQRLKQAGRCLGRAVNPHQAFSSCDELARGPDSGGGSSCFKLELGSPWPPIFPLADLSGGGLPL